MWACEKALVKRLERPSLQPGQGDGRAEVKRGRQRWWKSLGMTICCHKGRTLQQVGGYGRKEGGEYKGLGLTAGFIHRDWQPMKL